MRYYENEINAINLSFWCGFENKYVMVSKSFINIRPHMSSCTSVVIKDIH